MALIVTFDRLARQLLEDVNGGAATQRKLFKLAILNWDFTAGSVTADAIMAAYGRDTSFVRPIAVDVAANLTAWHKRNPALGRRTIWELSEILRGIDE